MAVFESSAKWMNISKSSMVFFNLVLAFLYVVSAERGGLKNYDTTSGGADGSSVHERRSFSYHDFLIRAVNTTWQSHPTGYHHVWPEITLGWRIVVGTLFGFFGASFKSVAGVGGGGIFVPMLCLIVGFDPKSATAMSKCMVTGGAASTVYYNLKLRHPTLEMPIIDYDLALLIQPMLMLGISVGVAFNVIFAEWMLTALLILLFIVIATKTFFKGVEAWKKETIQKAGAARTLKTNGHQNAEVESNPLPITEPQTTTKKLKVTIVKNVYWMELGLIIFVWIAYLGIQIAKNYTTTCSVLYWVFNLLQIPVSVSVSLYQAISLYKGRRVISSRGDHQARPHLQAHQLLLYCVAGVIAGVIGGMLGLGGGFIMVPLFLEIGVPPQVSSATATFAMAFSSSMSVIEYYLLKRFPVPYAMYFVAVATLAALVGQHIVQRVIIVLGRASLIIFVLAFVLSVNLVALGGIGILHMIRRIERHDYMGFDNLCKYG